MITVKYATLASLPQKYAYIVSGVPHKSQAKMTTTCLEHLSPEDYASAMAGLSGRETKAWVSSAGQFVPVDTLTFSLVESNTGRKVLKQTAADGANADLRSPPLEVTGFLNDESGKMTISFQCEESRATPELDKFWDTVNRLYGPDGELAKAYVKHHKDMIPGALPKGLAKHVGNDGVGVDLNCEAGVRGRFFFSPAKQNRGPEGNQTWLVFKIYTTAPSGDLSKTDREALAEAFEEDHPLRVALEQNNSALASNAFTVADGKPIPNWSHGGKLQWLPILNAMSKPTKAGVIFKGFMSLQMGVQASWVNDTLFTTSVYLNGPGAKLYATPAPRGNGPDAGVTDEDAEFFASREAKRKLAETGDDDGEPVEKQPKTEE